VNDLTAKEQKAVRTALRFLRLRVGAWGPLAKALRYQWDSIQKVATGKKAVTPGAGAAYRPVRRRADGRATRGHVAVACTSARIAVTRQTISSMRIRS
jgi:hypothetical protein